MRRSGCVVVALSRAAMPTGCGGDPLQRDLLAAAKEHAGAGSG